jgi:hypothetical protein
MIYHMFMPRGGSDIEMSLDLYLGSVHTFSFIGVAVN